MTNHASLRPHAAPVISSTPDPPYYAVIFTSIRTAGDNGYGDMADRIAALVADQPGYIGMESARGADGLGITVCYWNSLESIAAWKRETTHREAQRGGHEKWYEAFRLRVCLVERDDGLVTPGAGV